MKDLEIRIGSGIGDAYFGFTQKALIEKLGPPDVKKWNEHKDPLLYYNDLMTMFRFETSHSSRLGWIETDNPKCTLNGKKIFRMSRDNILDFVEQEFDAEIELTEYKSFQCCFCKNLWLEFQFRFERLNTICFGVLFQGENRVKWPRVPKN